MNAFVKDIWQKEVDRCNRIEERAKYVAGILYLLIICATPLMLAWLAWSILSCS